MKENNMKNEIRKLFLELVSIDSPSGNEKEVSLFICKKMSEFGIKNREDSYGNIIAKIAGKGEPLLLSAHMDTVEPGRNIKAIVKGDWIMSNGETILGADDKAGILEILFTLKKLKEEKKIHRPLEVIFTREEESGLFGSKNLDFSKISAKEGLVIDRNGKAAIVVIASPFVTSIDIEVWGRSSHAGNPENGINAIKIAANAIGKIKIGRIDEETTNNVGIISGGSARNAVAEMVLVHAEVRSHKKEKMLKQIALFKKVFQSEAKKNKAKIKFITKEGCHGYSYYKTEPLVKKVVAIWKKNGKTAVLEKAGGASDANNFAKAGIKVIDIGYGGLNPHTTREKIRISDMQNIIKFLVDFVSN
jgi:tripeptide aminopeptidase